MAVTPLFFLFLLLLLLLFPLSEFVDVFVCLEVCSGVWRCAVVCGGVWRRVLPLLIGACPLGTAGAGPYPTNHNSDY